MKIDRCRVALLNTNALSKLHVWRDKLSQTHIIKINGTERLSIVWAAAKRPWSLLWHAPTQRRNPIVPCGLKRSTERDLYNHWACATDVSAVTKHCICNTAWMYFILCLWNTSWSSLVCVCKCEGASKGVFVCAPDLMRCDHSVYFLTFNSLLFSLLLFISLCLLSS